MTAGVGPIERTSFRQLMSQWATGVSVITCLDDQVPAGCTANALTSLSLDPPRLLVCFDLSARTLASVRRSRRFTVNVLTASQEEICGRFASRASHADKFAGVPYRVAFDTVLLEDCMAAIVCEVADELVHGDHVIVVGDVIHGELPVAAPPLIFFQSQFVQLLERFQEDESREEGS